MILRLISAFLATILISECSAFWCYQCDSSDPGCGSEIDIMLQRWTKCQGAPYYCMKLIEKIGGNEHITRGCLNVFLQSTDYRLDMPTRIRHNYCLPGRNVDIQSGAKPKPFVDRQYCFCNDYNGCNPATVVRSRTGLLLFTAIVTSVLILLRFR